MHPPEMDWAAARFLPATIFVLLIWIFAAPGMAFWADLPATFVDALTGQPVSQAMVIEIIMTGGRSTIMLALCLVWSVARIRAHRAFGVYPSPWVWENQPKPQTLWERRLEYGIALQRQLFPVQKLSFREYCMAA